MILETDSSYMVNDFAKIVQMVNNSLSSTDSSKAIWQSYAKKTKTKKLPII